jgi:hypothetical protein
VAPKIEIGSVSDDLVRSHLELSASEYHDEPINDEVVVRWRHVSNSAGPSTTVELVDGTDHVGRMWIQTHPWWVDGRQITAANPIDFLIREDHRRLPSFMSLFKATMAECEKHADLVFHTSNPLTDDLYRKLFKLKPVTDLDGAAIPIRPFGAAQAAGVVRTGIVGKVGDSLFSLLVRAAGRLAKVGSVRFIETPTATQQAAVVVELLREEAVCGLRSTEHRAWRYHGAGPIQYTTQWFSVRGRVAGYIVVTDRDIEGIRARFVVDVVFPGSPNRSARWSLWVQAAGEAAVSHRQALILFYNRANPRLARLAAAPFITVSRRRLPQQIPVFVRPFRTSPVDGLDTVAWDSGYYLMSDFDLF